MPDSTSFLKRIGVAARQREQARTVRILEIVHVAAIRRRLALRAHVFDHAHDHSAAARAGKPANEKIVAGRGQLHAHAQRAQRALLPHIVRRGLDLRGRVERNARRIAVPAEFFRRQARVFWIGILAHQNVEGRYSSTALRFLPPALDAEFPAWPLGT